MLALRAVVTRIRSREGHYERGSWATAAGNLASWLWASKDEKTRGAVAVRHESIKTRALAAGVRCEDDLCCHPAARLLAAPPSSSSSATPAVVTPVALVSPSSRPPLALLSPLSRPQSPP